MTRNDLEQGLEGLSTGRLQRLVDALTSDPDVKLTVRRRLGSLRQTRAPVVDVTPARPPHRTPRAHPTPPPHR